jgi:hypothetical protein
MRLRRLCPSHPLTKLNHDPPASSAIIQDAEVDQSINLHRGIARQHVLYLYPENIVEYHGQVRRNGLDVPDLDVTFYGLTAFRLNDTASNPGRGGRRLETLACPT